MPVFTRLCPSCGRRVPQTVDVCRCGTDVSAIVPAGETESPGTTATGRGLPARVWIGVVVVAAAGGIAVGALSFSRPVASVPSTEAAPSAPQGVADADGAPPKATVAPPDFAPPIAAVQTVAKIPDAAGPSAAADLAAPPASAALPALPPPAPPALEDVMARVMPAVVLVETSSGRGSGFFISHDTLLTNVHVVGRNSSVTIRRLSGQAMPARVEATAPQVDVAVLKISTADKNQPTLKLGATADARIGQEVFAIGSALGLLQNTLTRGIVSGVRQTTSATLVQTDAAVNPGNSGGPLLDRDGTVLGIITMGFTDRQGLNFAVGIDHARALLGGTQQPPPAVRSTPPTPEMRALSPSQPSESDQTRAQGVRVYEQAMAQLSRRADTLENSWRQFRTSCYEGRIAGTFDREWFAVFDDRAMQGAVAPGCGRWFADFQRQAADVRDGVIAAEELARQADVYPGMRRDARRRHRLDYPGWER